MIPSDGKNLKQLELSYIAGGNVKPNSCFGKQFSSQCLIKVNIHLSYDPAIALLGIYLRVIKTYHNFYMNFHSSVFPPLIVK